MQLYILTSRTLTLRLHFYLGNVSGDSDFSFFRGRLVNFRSSTFHLWTPSQCLWRPNSSCKGSQGDMPTKIYPKHWKFREPLSSPKGYKLCDCFFPSTPVVLHLFLLCFPLLRESLGRDFTKMSDCCAIWKIPSQWGGKTRSGAKTVACRTALVDSTLPGKSLSR